MIPSEKEILEHKAQRLAVEYPNDKVLQNEEMRKYELKGYDMFADVYFGKKFSKVCANLGIQEEWLRKVMFMESLANPRAINPISEAVGLIQFMPATVRGLGTKTNDLLYMSGEEQLVFVEKYFRNEGLAGKMESISDVYAGVFYPACIGKPEDYILGSERSQGWAEKVKNQNEAVYKIGNGTGDVITKMTFDLYVKKSFVAFGFANEPSVSKRTLIVKLKSSDVTPVISTFSSTSISFYRGRVPQTSLLKPFKPSFDKKIFPFASSAVISRSSVNVVSAKEVDARAHLERYRIIDVPDTVDATALLNDLKKSADIEYTEPDYVCRLFADDWSVPNDVFYNEQWTLSYIYAQSAWGVTKGSPTVKIGIIDSGVDYTHPDLVQNIFINSAEDINKNGIFEAWSSSETRNGKSGDLDNIDQDGNGFTDDVSGWNFTDIPTSVENGNLVENTHSPGPNSMDKIGHGTSVAGVIAAQANNSIGIAGLAPNCKIVPLKIFSASQESLYSNIVQAMLYAISSGCQVVNMSFGGGYPSQLMQDVIRYAVSKNVVIVAAAGNSFSESVEYPSGYEETVTVTGVNKSGKNTLFNYGYQVDLAAPAVSVYTTKLGGGYASVSGTSFAAPIVSAAVGLMLSVKPTLSPEAVKNILKSTATDVGLTDKAWDIFTGAGALNSYKALLAVKESDFSRSRISNPASESGSSPQAVIPILGTASSPDFQSYSLYYKAGDLDGTWIPISENVPYQCFNDTLGKWQTESLKDSTYILRLAISTNSIKTPAIEHRIKYYLDATKPIVNRFEVSPIWQGNEEKLWVRLHTDEATSPRIYFRVKGSSDVQSLPLSNEHEFKLFHSEVVSLPVAFLNTPLEISIKTENKVGLKTNTITKEITLSSEKISEARTEKTMLSEYFGSTPFGKYATDALDVDLNGKRDVFSTGVSGAFRRFEWRNAQLTLIDSIQPTETAAYFGGNIADIQGNGLYDLLLYRFTLGSSLYEQSANDKAPFSALKKENPNVLAFLFAKTRGNTEWQIIGRHKTAYLILNQNLDITHTLPLTIAGRSSITPTIENAKAICNDFDNDGTNEILFADSEGNFYIYEWNGTSYSNVFKHQSKNFRGSQWIAAGRFLNKDKVQFAVATQIMDSVSSTDNIVQDVFKIELWESTANNQYAQVWATHVFSLNNASLSSLKRDKALSSGDVDSDGLDELLVAAQPNAYLFRANSLQTGMVPFWCAINRTNGYDAALIDIQGKGQPDILFSEGDRTNAWSYSASATLAPIEIAAEAQNASSIRLSWKIPSRSTGVKTVSYKLWRGSISQSNNSIPTLSPYRSGITETHFLDDGLIDANYYFYAVQAVSGSGESSLSETVKVFPSTSLRLITTNFSKPNFLSIEFSKPLEVRSQNISNFTLWREGQTQRFNPKGILVGENSQKVTLVLGSLDAGTYFFQCENLLMKGSYARLDETSKGVFSFLVPTETSQKEFFVRSFKILSPTSVSITFSESNDLKSATTLSKYELSPQSANDTTAARSESDHKTVTVTFSQPITNQSLGYSITLNFKNLKSETGLTISESSGGLISFGSTVKDNISDVFVFPNPLVTAVTNKVTFANMNKEGTIEIFDLKGSRIKEQEYCSSNGSVECELSHELPTGHYLYRVTTSTGETKLAKFALIR
ncbi:hypothetical protein CHS0354_024100 [Potamilus streckersoni]|uniref:Fibronectin type-III domain-containing protein n=1 Tax=Potamilus streckersoni TaxID=2493646 RepID=A0AAE0RZF1_9BIVA|nr:hypothetical protein CHS0354_024100 [Potamilus streckersoni]